jgi:hypothetical protein
MNLYLEGILLEGTMPERALLKLRRAQIPLFHVEKLQKNQILFHVMKKDVEKVFAIYPKMCYNKATSSAYLVRDCGGAGLQKAVDFCKKRVAFLLGALLFCIGCLAVEPYVFGIKIVGSSVYEREIKQTLEEFGAKPFCKYPLKNQEKITARLLCLDGVEFCSVQKVGTRVRVEMRLYSLPPVQMQKGDMRSLHTGTITAITALRGTLAKKAGDSVRQGETLVYGWYSVEGKGQVSVEPIARVSIACVYEEELQAENEEQAFANAYLSLVLSDGDKITKKQIEKTETGFFVRIEYTAIESVNL